MKKTNLEVNNANMSFAERREFDEVVSRIKAALPYASLLSVDLTESTESKKVSVRINSKLQTVELEKLSDEKSFCYMMSELELEIYSILKIWRRERCVFERIAA